MPDGYGMSGATPESRTPWETIAAQLTRARNYWLCTVRYDDRPHAMPVWGLWVNDHFLFSTDPSSRKGVNLAERPDAVMHLESGDDVVVVDGPVSRIPVSELPASFVDDYEAKYGFRINLEDSHDPDAETAYGFYSLKPRTVLVWDESDFPGTATRWRFPEP